MPVPRRRTILVTGGTGTLGRELVRRLAADADAPRVLVLARDPSAAPARALAEVPAGRRGELRLLRGDLRAGAALGLDRADADALSAEVTELVHCAAATTFTLPLDEARATNVEGTRAVLAFAAGCRSLERVACFSTVYVAGRRTGAFGEDDRGCEGAGYVNSYEQSKGEMEDIVRAAMSRLPLALYRLSTLIGDSRTGAVYGFNAVHHALRLLYQGLAPMVPGNPAHRVDLIPVDFAADAAHWLFRHAFEPGRVYHLCTGAERSSTLDALVDATVDAFRRFRPAWRKRSIERPLLVDLATYELFVRSVEETGNEVLRQATRAVQAFAYQLAYPKVFHARRAEAALAAAGVRAPAVLDYYQRVIRYCVETNWGAEVAA
jgi:nucleoside-diphosphate-sugar epimerase